jgi:hypothetical protein
LVSWTDQIDLSSYLEQEAKPMRRNHTFHSSKWSSDAPEKKNEFVDRVIRLVAVHLSQETAPWSFVPPIEIRDACHVNMVVVVRSIIASPL